MDRRHFVFSLISAPAASGAEIIRNNRIWDAAPHNAFTDLAMFRGRFYAAFREGARHVSPDGAIRILTSEDGRDWKSAALLTSASADLRDPKLCVTPKNELMVTAAAANHNAPPRHQTYAWFSRDGLRWPDPTPIGEPDFWLWRVTWHKRTAYSAGYNTAGANFVRLYHSRDGRQFDVLVDRLLDQGSPNEAALRFDRDDSALCLIRRERDTRSAMLGRARPPYTEWQWKDLGKQLGGPNLIQLPDLRWVAAGRLYDGGQRTAVCLLDPNAATLSEQAPLPSNGDSSYPGLVWHKNLLWVSYYSSHEGKTNIYLARIRWP